MFKVIFLTHNLVPTVQHFIDTYWKNDHILAISREVFDFQYYDKYNNRYNMLIAIDEETMTIGGVLGFTRLSQFDPISVDDPVCLALWKKRTSDVPVMLGYDLLKTLCQKFEKKTVDCSGINVKVAALYKYLGFKCGEMNHYYFTNRTETQIALNLQKSILHENYFVALKEIVDLSLVNDPPNLIFPYKSNLYFHNRYHCCPFYKYKIYGFFAGNTLMALFAIRKEYAMGHYCLRIIDISGDLASLGNCSTHFDRLLRLENAEYIDCLNYGLEPSLFIHMGFMLKTGDTVVPDHFAPFELCNTPLRITFLGREPVLFKGDGDQDRPNFLGR